MRSIWEFTPIFLGDPEQVPFTFWTSIPHLNKKGMKLDGWFSNFKTLEPLLRIKSKLKLIKREAVLVLEVGPSRGSAHVPSLLGSLKPHSSDFHI